MTNKEIVETLKEEIVLLRNCTNDTEMIAILMKIKCGDEVTMCKCPQCGMKFTPEEGFKSGIKLLREPIK